MKYRLLMNECLYSIFSAYLLSFARAIAEVGAVAMVGGAIAWKTNVMTTAIMMYTNRGSFTLGIALGLILKKAFRRAALLRGKTARLFCHILIAMSIGRMILRIIRCQTCRLAAKSIEFSIDFAIRWS